MLESGRRCVRRVLFLVAHYGDEHQVRAFCDQLERLQRPDSLEVSTVIVDNSRDWSEKDPADGATLFRPQENLGYLGGAAWGFERWNEGDLAVNVETLVVVSNTDLVFEEGFLVSLDRYAVPEGVGVIAPDVRSVAGQHLNPHLARRMGLAGVTARYLATKSGATWGMVETRARRRAVKSAGPPPTADMAVYAPHGCIFILTSRFFDRGGSLQPPSFMYGEELHIAEEALSLGLSVVVAPELGCTHLPGGMADRSTGGQRRRWFRESYGAHMKRRFGRRKMPSPHRSA